MKLAELLKHLSDATIETPEAYNRAADETVAGVTSDSRQVQPGTVFVALGGSRTDGHQFLANAAASGATALLIEAGRKAGLQIPDSVAVISVPNTWKALSELSGALNDFPGQKLRMVGVTGTNGKTTVTHLIEQMLEDQGRKVGLIGTLGRKSSASRKDGSQQTYESTGHTTPMATELHEILAEMRDEGNEIVVMEVSSHALEQHRVHGCDFEVAVLTNVTQDHLDYHKTMDQYWRAKALLFSNLTPNGKKKSAVINLDSDYAQEFVKACPPGATLYTYAIQSPDANVRIENPNYSIAGSSFTVITPAGKADVKLKLGGQFSVYNALAAIASGLALEIPLADCVKSIERVPGIRGRFEVVAEKPYVIVDYAHTPDGLENVLNAARVVTPKNGRLIAVFGCGGDRDATKRPKMGRITERLADLLVITSDNPRTEDPQQIITDIISGIQRFDSSRMVVDVDRKQAIHAAIDMAQPEDIIVVAGKGHEDYQILGDRTIHFDDREVVQEYVKQKRELSSV
ncbi:MAG TPA: UDP-N-acetylmuramoyl-L-alanyl-D-glutamate--2,6-diaminopimelate ligase [Coleofasciculaceae cyanobacterium]|jgi:UDP-N-acetylmuramoyl-L-alanyl-D-glutamate--2,6-diaminopimelate ligase